VQVAVGPAHRRLDVFVELVKRAILDLDAPPDRGPGVEQGDLELVEALGGGDGTEATGAFEGLGRNFGDVPQRVAHQALVGVPNGFPGLLFDLLQLGQRELDRPLVALVQLQPVGKPRGVFGHDLPLGVGEPDRDVLWNCGHRVTPASVRELLAAGPVI
jgi:hypothetical protein